MAYQPKSYRKFVATAATATLVATAVTPAFAAGFTDINDRVKDAVNYLVEKEITQGMTDTKFGTNENIKRMDAAIWIANALKLDTKNAPDAGFTDVSARGKGAVNALKAAGIINGKTETKFGANDPLTRGEMAKIITKAYDLSGSGVENKFTDVAGHYTDAVNALVKNEITLGKTETTFGTHDNIIRGDLAVFLYRAENPKPVEAAKVAGVSAINASELKVTFTQPVDKKTAENAANYDLKINNTPVPTGQIIDINLSKDGKSATLLLDQQAIAFQNGDKYVIQTNDAILSKDGKKLEKFVSNEATFSETAAPALVSVAKKGDNLELAFNRPVDADKSGNDVTLVKIDGVEIGSKDLKPVKAKDGNAEILGEAGEYKYTIAITDPAAKAEAKKVGTHEVVIFDVADTAASYEKVASVLTGSYTVTDQVTTPEVTGIEAVNANRFFVYTNTAVTLDKDSVVTVNKGTHEFQNADKNYDDPVVTDSATKADATVGLYKSKPGIWVVVTDNSDNKDEENPLYRSGEAAVNLTVTVEKFQADGLIGKKSVQNVTLNKNNTKPVVETTVLKEDTAADELVVKFTNSLAAGTALTEGTDFVVRDKDGVIIEGFNADVDGQNVTFSKNTKLKDAPYTVEFKADKFKNAVNLSSVEHYLANTVKNDKIVVSVGKEASSNFKYVEHKFPEVTETSAGSGIWKDAADKLVIDTKKNTITFKYDQKMSDSARNVANYTLDGKTLPAGTTADFVGDRQTVRIVFPEGTFKTSTQYKFGVTTNVKTESDSIIVGSLQTKAPAELVFGVTDNVKPELASAVYYVGTETVDNKTKTDKIELTFNEALNISTANAEDDFKVVLNGSEFEVDSVDTVASGDKADHKLVLKLAQQVNVSQASTITVVAEDQQTDKTMGVTDKANNKAKEGSTIKLDANKVKYSASLAAQHQANADIDADVTALATPTVGGADLGTLPTSGANGTTIAWESSDATKLSNAGAFVAGPATVTLTAKISKAPGATQTVTFEVTTDATQITNITKK
ncbi:S-layer homology domain-containing protein [Bacillus sp. Hm123]|uniref:S-layer homology domain-containing protein n=1 Tax=Bacillus sp. Hm123 TaxID=3450745 RepID=UPI003F42E34A